MAPREIHELHLKQKIIFFRLSNMLKPHRTYFLPHKNEKKIINWSTEESINYVPDTNWK